MATEISPSHLYGLWRVEFAGLPQNATLRFEKHPGLVGNVSGGINRDGVKALIAGDVDQREFSLEESLDGQRIAVLATPSHPIGSFLPGNRPALFAAQTTSGSSPMSTRPMRSCRSDGACMSTQGITLRHCLKADTNSSVRLEWLRNIADGGIQGSRNGLRFHTQLSAGCGDSLADYNRRRTVLSRFAWSTDRSAVSAGRGSSPAVDVPTASRHNTLRKTLILDVFCNIPIRRPGNPTST